MKNKQLLKVIIAIVVIALISVVVYFAMNPKQSNEPDNEDKQAEEDTDKEGTIAPTYENIVTISQDGDNYLMEITVLPGNQYDFSEFENQNIYLCVEYDGTAHDNINYEKENPIYKIPLEDGKLVTSFNIQITNENNPFTGNSLEKLNEYLSGKQNYLNVGLVYYDPQGNLLYIYNYIVIR